MEDSGTSRSRTSSTYSSTAVRPRNKRYISGFEDFSEEAISNPTPLPSNGDSYFSFSRLPSPIPSRHPSRSSSLRPSTSRALGDALDNGTNDLAASLGGLLGKSWTSLQGLASNVLGSDLSSDPIKNNPHRPSRRPSPSSSRPGTSAKQWGPSGALPQTQPGEGSKKERSAIVTAKKREELLRSNGHAFSQNAAANYKRRTSDDFGSVSAPPSDSDNRETLIYIHHVKPQDTLAGISIRYNCQLVTIKKVNRMWSNDGVQARKTIMIPLESCTIRGRKVAGPGDVEHDLIETEPSLEVGKWDHRRSSIVTITPITSGVSNGDGQQEPEPETVKPAEDTPWTHDSWTILEGQTEPTEIARLPRQSLGYFPRPRRRSGSISSIDRSSLSLEMPRPSITVSDTSSGKVSLHKSRRSSGSNQFAQQMLGPGGVGSLKGKGPSTPGPAEDKFTKVFRKQAPGMIKTPGAGSDEDFFTSSSTTPNFAEFGQAVEVWAKKLSKGLAKALEPPTPDHVRRQRRAAGFSSTSSGDLIELEASFDVGEDFEDNSITPTNGPFKGFNGPQRGRRGSVGEAGTNGTRLHISQHAANRSRSHGASSNNDSRRKGD